MTLKFHYSKGTMLYWLNLFPAFYDPQLSICWIMKTGKLKNLSAYSTESASLIAMGKKFNITSRPFSIEWARSQFCVTTRAEIRAGDIGLPARAVKQMAHRRELGLGSFKRALSIWYVKIFCSSRSEQRFSTYTHSKFCRFLVFAYPGWRYFACLNDNTVLILLKRI